MTGAKYQKQIALQVQVLSITQCCVWLQVVMLLFPVSHAFSTHQICPTQYARTSPLRFAYIFGEDGGTMTELETDQDTGFSFFSTPSSSSYLFPPSMLKDMSRLQADKAMLARLAAAFPPVGIAIPLPNIEHVTILQVEQTSITLSAVVRSDDQCVTIAVPVAFPSPCSCNGFSFTEEDEQAQQEQLEECVLKSLRELDQKAQTIVQQQAQVEANYEAIQAYQRQAAELRRIEEVDFPSWWIPPAVVDSMDVESKSLRSLLNEDDFQPNVQTLAKYGIRLQLQEDYYIVLQAGIRSISPAGLMLGALIRDPQDDPEQEENLARNTIVVDVPIPFSKQAADANQLRDNVLDMVETVE
jgi:hypothetical protein